MNNPPEELGGVYFPEDYPTQEEIANARAIVLTLHDNRTLPGHILTCYREDEQYYYCLYPSWMRGGNPILQLRPDFPLKVSKKIFRAREAVFHFLHNRDQEQQNEITD